jgi:hypothetical protein
MATISSHSRLVMAATSVMIAAVCLALLPGSAAQARTASVADPVNANARADIRAVSYTNREFSTTVTVKVRSLGATGRLSAWIAQPDSDVLYLATVRRTTTGALIRRLDYVTNVRSYRRACPVAASWSRSTNLIRVTLPHSCLRFGSFLTHHWFRAHFNYGAANDDAASRVVGRGDSPGCVTSAEFRRVVRGHALGVVHGVFDTAGRFADGAAGGYSRLYRQCGTSSQYWVEYNGLTHRVTAKRFMRA